MVRADPTDRQQRLAKCFADFDRFCGLLKIQPKGGGGRIPLVLSPVQRAYCEARSSRDIVLKARQVHMTTCEAARDLWWFLTKHGARVVIVCQSQTDQGPLSDISYKIRLFIDSLRKIGVKLEFGKETATEWTLPDRDATMRLIQAGASEDAAERKGRGGTVNRLHLSEMAFWGAYAADTFNSLNESVPRSGSEVVIESTPNGASGEFHSQWRAAVEGRSGYQPLFYSWWLHPEYRLPLSDEDRPFKPRSQLEQSLVDRGATAEAIAWRRWKVRDKGGNEQLVSQEFPNDAITCFLVSGRGFFDSLSLERLIHAAKEPLRVDKGEQSGSSGQTVGKVTVPALRIWEEPKADASYVIGSDTSDGTGGSASSGIVLERGTGKHVATLWGQFRPWVLAKHLASVGHYYNDADIAVERNNTGLTVLRALDVEQGYENVLCDVDERPGYLTSPATRAPMLDTLEEAVRSRAFETNDIYMLDEMKNFVVVETAHRERPEHARGSRDDLVLGGAIAWDAVCRTRPRRARLTGIVA